MKTTNIYQISENRGTIRKSLLELLMMKNKLIFALIFLISAVVVRIFMLKYFLDISPLIVALAFLLIKRDKFSSFSLKLFNPLSFFVIIVFTYIALGLMIVIQSYFKLTEFSAPTINRVLIFSLIALIPGFTEEIAWRGYLFSKLKMMTWLQITLIINLI